jgi:hypothetical protein
MKKTNYITIGMVMITLLCSFNHVVIADPINLALNKVITATSSVSSSNGPEKANDSDLTTYWKSNNYIGSITIQLGAAYLVSAINLKFENAYGFNIEGSNGGVTYTSILTATATSTTQTQNLITTPNTFTHIRINITSVVSSTYCGIYDIAIFSSAPPLMTTIADKVQSNGNYPLVLNATGGNVGIGTLYPGSFKLAVEGKIGAREVNVLTGPWPDYVFDVNYDLLSLTEVESFIKLNKHLPGVPAASHVEMNGVNLGEMNTLLMKKVEELTLYLIELKNVNDMIKQSNEDLQKQNSSLNDRLSKLENK